MNANGYAQCQPSERLYHYMSSENGAGSATWSNPALAVGRNPAVGVTLHEYMGTIAGDGTVHLFGQWQLGAESGGFGYLRRRPGDALWDSFGVAAAYRPPGLIYFAAGVGYVPPVRNAQGSFDVHLAFEWNKQGDYPRYGLHYLVSHDGGATFGSVDGSVQYDFGARGSLGPAEADSTSVAVIPAALGGASYSGGQPASELGLALGATLDGQPVILRLDCQAADCAGGAAQLGTTQARVWTYLPPSRSWVAVPVGPPLNFYALGAGLAVRGDTGNVNVVLLDNGFAADGTKHPPQVLQLVESIDDLRAGKSTWTSRVVRTIQTTSYADALRVTVVPDCRFEILVDGSDSYQLVPEFLESAIE
jgi:hypothetical protein